MRYTTEELDRMLAAVQAEQMGWKLNMRRLVDIVRGYATPSECGAIWLLVLGVCARSKACTNCPHSITWRKLVRIRIPETKRKAALAQGKSTPKFFYRWSNQKTDRSASALPRDMHCAPQVRQAYRAFETVRATIMEHHEKLSTLSRKLKCCRREASQIRAVQGRGSQPMDAIIDLLLHSQARERVERDLLALQRKYPSCTVWKTQTAPFSTSRTA